MWDFRHSKPIPPQEPPEEPPDPRGPLNPSREIFAPPSPFKGKDARFFPGVLFPFPAVRDRSSSPKIPRGPAIPRIRWNSGVGPAQLPKLLQKSVKMELLSRRGAEFPLLNAALVFRSFIFLIFGDAAGISSELDFPWEALWGQRDP